jgi:Tol biopolymer transport system component
MKPFLIVGKIRYRILTCPLVVPALAVILASGIACAQTVGFTAQTNVGNVKIPGSVRYDSTSGTFTVTGNGNNMWATEDDFYYDWLKAKGDLTLKANIGWVGEGKQPHRKAGWMLRAGLEKDDPYVDAVDHGVGLICMQYRETKGGTTKEVQSPISWPATLMLERTGDQFTLTLLKDSTTYPIGTITVHLPEEVYVGLAVCSHDSTVAETAIFSNLGFDQRGVVSMENRILESTLETIDVDSGVRTIVYRAKEHFEAPNWSRDGKTLLYNNNGRIYTIPVAGGTPKLVNTGFADKCNNDHGLSPDGELLAVSDQSKDGKSRIYVLPSSGGEPKLITESAPSYWHGWSPDGKTLAYCAERNGNFDVYTISVNGGEEKRLTDAPGLDDGPDYSPDGKFIYFNSVRTGQMKIWRMNADGTDQVQVTPNDEYADWFAHPSPDGKWIVFVSYDKGVEGHPANKDVVLRIMSTIGGEPKVLATLFGGQGTMNVPSWSPDSKRIAFVSYRLLVP